VKIARRPAWGSFQQYGAALALLALYVATSTILKAFSNDSDWAFCNFGLDGGWAACDQPYHIDEINYFIGHPEHWLRYPDPWQTATLPGFHLFVAFIARVVGAGPLGPDSWLRIIPFLLGALVLGVLWRVFRDLSESGRAALVLCLPILWSNYFYLPSLFLVTENAAYLGYALLLLAYLEFPRRGAIIGTIAAATVFVRQLFLPVTLAPAALLAFRAYRPDGNGWRSSVIAILPGLLVFLLYYFAWGGPVPREVLGEHSAGGTIESGPLLQALSLLGLLAVPYALLLGPALRTLGRSQLIAITSGAIIAAALMWLVLPTSRDLDAGRAGSVIWLLARIAPLGDERAILVFPCLALGCAALGAMVAFARERDYCPIELVMFGLYVVGLSLQRLSYQRYSEVVTLILLSATAARWGLASRTGTALFLTAYAIKLFVTLAMPQGG
jgi:hypothetical protein